MKRVALSPWARAALPIEVEARLEDRAAEAGCYVSTVKRSGTHGLWIARAFSRNSQGISRHSVAGTVEAAVLGAIEKYEASLFSTEELVQLYRQSV